MRSEPLEARFERSVDRSSDCWIWTVGWKNNGYGVMRTRNPRGSVLAHRYSWELTNGPIPDGLCVLHRCDNRACVRPEHLFLGTRRDNANDMAQKGRAARRSGRANPNARLTAEQVAEIRRLYRPGARRQGLAERFGVSHHQIYMIGRGDID